MREFATKLYKSKQWQHTRDAYLKSVGGLCENCIKQGIYRPAEIIHHIEHVEPWNIENPEVTLSWNNLEALCRDCHAEQHKRTRNKRYEVDDNGNVRTILE